MELPLHKKTNPSVSVILPTFNRGYVIDRAINSVVQQTYKDWELIIVDDGSTDDTFEIINGYIEKFDNFRFIKHSNRRPPLSTNTGIQASCGKFLTFLGSDDEYKKEHLAIRVSFMEQNRNVDLIHGGVEIVGNPFVKDKNDLSRQIHLSDCIIGGTFFGKRKVFFDLEGFKNINYSEDSDFYERAVLKFKVQKVGFPTYIYHRDSPDSICDRV